MHELRIFFYLNFLHSGRACTYHSFPFSEPSRISVASLVAQWLRIRLPMQGTRVRALVQEDPTSRGATGPVSHNY